MQALSLSRISEISENTQNLDSFHQKTKRSKVLKAYSKPTHAQNIVFIDENVDRYQDLAEGIKSDTQVFILDSRYDGVKQISQILEDYQELDSIQIVSHGTVGTINLGSTFLTLENLAVYQLLLQQWKKVMKAGGGILLLGCTIAAGKQGANFVRKLSQLTGINIAASEDLTGCAALGGNWNLGFSTGEISASLAFESEVLAAYSSVLSVLIDETFRGATVAGPWVFGKGIGGINDPYLTAAPIGSTGVFPGPPTGTPDPVGNGALRLKSATNNDATFVIYNNSIASNAGLVFTFDLFAYGGGEPGADGISFFLIDGNTSTLKVGGFGGSLGYAQRLDQNFSGLSGGYVGIGFDEFGNFPTKGLFSQQERPTGIDNQPGISAVAIRGKTGSSDPTGSSLTTGYDYLTGNTSLPAPIGFPNQTTRSDTIRRRARITLTPDQTLAVDMDFNNNGSFSDPGENVIPAFNLQTGADVAGLGRTIPANGTVPATFKFGFASSTGSSKNIHEVRDLKVETVNPPTNQADIVTTKTGPATVEPNGNITYSLTTTNNGPNEAVNVLLQDQLPASLTFVSASNGGGLDATNPKTQVITWPVIPTLGVGQSVNYTLTVQAPASGGPFVNGAFSTATTFDPNSSNNNGTASNAQVTTAIASGADVSTTKTGPATASPGSTIAYTITTTNNGSGTATNVVISDQLSPGLSGVQVSDGGSYNSTTGLVSFPPIASLANGNSTTRTISFTAPAEGTTIADTVSSTSDTPDPNPANNDGTATNAKVTTTVAPSADIAVTKAGVTTALPGEVVTYTITATNNGPSTATNVAITDTLPTNLVGVQASNNGTYDPSTGIVTFPAIASLAQGAIASRTVTIKAPSSGSIVNTAKSTAATTDPTPTNNNGTASTATVTTTISSTVTPKPPNQPPLANNVNLNLPVGSTSQVVGLGATDPDGTIAFYTINTLPLAAQGVLYLGDPANGGTSITTDQNLTPTQLTQLFFQSTGNFTGTNFTYSATDNQGAVSPAAATVAAIASPNQPPVTTNASFNLPANSTTNLTGLGATDPDGTIASYTLNTLPLATQGTLYVGDPANGGTPATAGQILTPDQINQLVFQSTGNFTGANFTYSATDNQGATSLASAGVSLIQPTTNQPPVVSNVNVSLPVGRTTQVTGLEVTDPDGTIASYTINTLPPAAQGVLYLGDPATGGTPVTANQTLTPTELDQLFFQSNAGFTQGSFTYSATDNLGATSLVAGTVSAIASPNQPPVTNNVNTRLGQGVKAQLTGLGGTDPDGAISAYRINTLPVPEQGALYLGDPENGGTSVTVGQTLTPNQLGQLLFQSAVTFTGADFTYSAIDNRSTASLTPGTVALIKPVTPPPTPLPNPTPTPAIVSPPTPATSVTPTPTPEIAPTPTPTTSATPTPTPTTTPVPTPTPTPISAVPITPTSAPSVELTPPLNLESIVFFSPVVEPDTTCDCETLPERPSLTFPSAPEQPQVTFDGPDGSLIATDRIVDGSEGDDILNGSNSNERFLALQGNDTLLGKAGDNILYGHEDRDEILAGQGSDIVFGGKQNDVIQGGKGRDRIFGDLNSDTLYGDRNSDTLVGDNGQYDSLNFANNRDLLFGNSEDDVINGTEGSDTVYGGKAQDIAYGGKQNDWVTGDLDADTLVGDLGDDSLFGGSFNPLVSDSEGRDLLLGQEGSDLLYAQDQEDTLVGGSDLDALFGGKQDDHLFGESNSDTLYGNRGRDILVGDYGGPNPIGSAGEQDFLFGNGSGDAIAGGLGNDTVHAGKQEDIVYGGKDPDLMWGEFANDTLIGDEGDDTLYGGTANSSVRDFQGQDLLLGTGGVDFLNGNEGNDSLSGGNGNDTLRGGENEDLLQGDAGDDWIAGDRGNDDLCGGDGNDTLFGDSEATVLGTGDDCINGNNGDDLIYGNDGSDTLNGDANNDSLIGGKGNDILSGGDGNDWLVGGLGVDSLIGGLGSDSFALSPDGDSDAVFNFEVGQDKFVLTGGLTFDQLLISQGGNGASIQIASTGQAIATVLGASNLLTQTDFLLV